MFIYSSFNSKYSVLRIKQQLISIFKLYVYIEEFKVSTELTWDAYEKTDKVSEVQRGELKLSVEAAEACHI